MDSRDTRKALYPQLSVEMSFADYAANIDPVLSVISNYKEQQSIDDLLNVFTSNSKTQNLNHSNPGTTRARQLT
jgi:hypothetical protein